MHGIRRGSTRASPFSLRISARAPCAVAGVRLLKCAHRWPGDDVPIRALSGLYWKLTQVIGMDRSFYGRWSGLQRGLIAIRGIYRKLSEFNGIYWEFSRPQLPTTHWLAANYRLFSLVLRLFPGSGAFPCLGGPLASVGACGLFGGAVSVGWLCFLCAIRFAFAASAESCVLLFVRGIW